MPSSAPHIVGLPWYDHSASRDALDRFWKALREHLLARGVAGLPEHLERTLSPQAQWASPRLLLSQSCGPDLFARAGAALEAIARPVFATLDAPPGCYFSHVVTAVGGETSAQRRAVRIAVNAATSRSGCGALLEWLAQHRVEVRASIVSGAHQASIDLVREGRADIAAIDAHAWQLLDHHGVTIVGRTASAPSPPWVSHAQCEVPREVLLTALRAAVYSDGAALGITNLLPAQRMTYAAMVGPTTVGL